MALLPNWDSDPEKLGKPPREFREFDECAAPEARGYFERLAEARRQRPSGASSDSSSASSTTTATTATDTLSTVSVPSFRFVAGPTEDDGEGRGGRGAGRDFASNEDLLLSRRLIGSSSGGFSGGGSRSTLSTTSLSRTTGASSAVSSAPTGSPPRLAYSRTSSMGAAAAVSDGTAHAWRSGFAPQTSFPLTNWSEELTSLQGGRRIDSLGGRGSRELSESAAANLGTRIGKDTGSPASTGTWWRSLETGRLNERPDPEETCTARTRSSGGGKGAIHDTFIPFLPYKRSTGACGEEGAL